MFAVPGWSVSADKLKSEITNATANGNPSAPKPKKRKRPGRTNENVTAANVADLWERVIEHKEAPKTQSEKKKSGDGKEKSEKREKKRQKTEGTQEATRQKESVEPPEQPDSSSKAESRSQKKDKKDKKKKKHHDSGDSKDELEPSQELAQALKTAAAPAPKLTPLQASMREKLISARFRHLNETLYTRPSAEAYHLFQESPEMFQEYHEGFRRQVGVWPENPVDGYIADIRQRGRARYPPKDNYRGRHHAPHHGPQKNGVQPLPRTDGTCTIADLGCGDARLASSLQKDKGKLRLEILSYDLHSPAPLVTKADIANLPLADGAVDLAIFCLALMGTNWVDFIEEAYRVLRWKGELWIAEIKSRFGPVGGAKKAGKHAVVEHSVGNRQKAGAGGKKGKSKDGEDPEANEAELAVEVDGVEDRRQQTDVSAFVEALRKRGFVLQGEAEEAVDLSNKMFVKMRFVKVLPPVKGKGVAAARMREAVFDAQRKQKKKFIEDEADGEVNESAILKPCVYKIR